MRLSRAGGLAGGGGGWYLNIKLVYMSRAWFKNRRIRERTPTENEGLSERPLTGKTGDLVVKNNKETYFLTRVFSICPAGG